MRPTVLSKPRCCVAWLLVVLLLGLLAVVTGRVVQPRYQGKTADEWFAQAMLHAPQLLRTGGGPNPEPDSFKECALAFQRMGNRGIRRVVDAYVIQTPFYLEWYHRVDVALRPVLKLPPRAGSNRFLHSPIAHRLLLRIGRDAVPELIRKTRSRNPAVRAQVVTVLGELGPGNPEAQACLFRMLGDPSPEVIYRSLEVLWMTLPESGSAVPMIVPFLTHTNARVRVESTYSVGCLSPLPEPVLQTLVTLLSDSDGTVRANSARAIGLSEVRLEWIYASLEAQLADTNPVGRFRAAEALVRLYGREATNRAAGLLNVLAEAEGSSQPYFRLIGFNARTVLGESSWSHAEPEHTFLELFSHPAAYIPCEAMAGLRLRSETHQTPIPPEIRNLVVAAQADVNGLVRHQAALLLQSASVDGNQPALAPMSPP